MCKVQSIRVVTWHRVYKWSLTWLHSYMAQNISDMTLPALDRFNRTKLPPVASVLKGYVTFEPIWKHTNFRFWFTWWVQLEVESISCSNANFEKCTTWFDFNHTYHICDTILCIFVTNRTACIAVCSYTKWRRVTWLHSCLTQATWICDTNPSICVMNYVRQ